MRHSAGKLKIYEEKVLKKGFWAKLCR